MRISFIHHSLRDYLAGERLYRELDKKCEDEQYNIIKEPRLNPNWEEAIGFTAGLMTDVIPTVRAILRHSSDLNPADYFKCLRLAGKCMLESRTNDSLLASLLISEIYRVSREYTNNEGLGRDLENLIWRLINRCRKNMVVIFLNEALLGVGDDMANVWRYQMENRIAMSDNPLLKYIWEHYMIIDPIMWKSILRDVFTVEPHFLNHLDDFVRCIIVGLPYELRKDNQYERLFGDFNYQDFRLLADLYIDLKNSCLALLAESAEFPRIRWRQERMQLVDEVLSQTVQGHDFTRIPARSPELSIEPTHYYCLLAVELKERIKQHYASGLSQAELLNDQGWNIIICEGRYTDALEYIEQALNLSPNFHSAWRNKGIALKNLERLDEAIACYDKIINEIDADYLPAWTNKAYALALKGDKQQARQCVQKALELDPNSQHARMIKRDYNL